MKATWMGTEQRPYRRNGIPQSHADMLKRHVAVLQQSSHRHVDPEMYEPGISCEGTMVLHGENEVSEDGTLVPHWDGSAHFHTVVCLDCGDQWSVETDYRRVQMKGSAGIEVEEEEEPIPW